MLYRIIRFSVRNKLIIGLMTLALIIAGVVAINKLPIDAVPDITNNQVLIITSAPSLGAPDVERFITVPVELATRNIAGITEQRSFSRFGLSLVTLVFNDKTDVYWARQQVSERLAKVQSQIPEGMGIPEMGPVTTGLGEIYQYVIKAKKGYEQKYGLRELRDIQDWIVRRQLLGTEGVADVSSFGGLVKQYEVAVNTDKLNSLKLTVGDVFNALKENNQNSGGAYIEKGANVLFIRSEGMVNNIDDINNIVVKQVNNEIPVAIKDVAKVQLGNAIRFGATVYNKEGEVAGAVVMMLKGANSNHVINKIKNRIKEIEHSLPEGVVLEPFLDRTKMVNNAIGTVEQNLLEGALIVILILVLFLGNIRAGFIVASVIPLSMLFAVIMMNYFGVSGNLMSLGALDFGLLVDGAVIIVEAVMHKLMHHTGFKEAMKVTQPQMDAEVETSAGKMMNSAVFGQIIILIVYLPILSLEGIEGKMFKPMAQTVSFAIIGAFLLSLTYVPMMTALCLNKKERHKENLSDKLMRFFHKIYIPALKRTMQKPYTIITAGLCLFIVAVWVLLSLGGEFIPKLEEGDFAVDTRLLTGSSLTNTIQTTKKAAGLLKEKFPEVEKVVTKIGAGEIPTDPMPLEAADMMVILKDKKKWTSAKTFDELAEKMSKTLQEVPGVATGFQFPVQMRFNELMTGARQDVVCKIFGDDLDTLATSAQEIGKIIQSVKGAKDLYVETVTGIPQMVITYNRDAIARFGANINDINNTVRSAYAGSAAGLVFEGDKRYDLVIRLDETQKKDINNIGNLMVGVKNGQQVTLNVLASIELKDGPYQIQREDARRRITVGFNVRGRDVQSIVNELQEKVAKKIKLPSGYYVTYGGQYENLKRASERLSIAVPVALLLILIMLYFAFNKIKYCLLIFSAIPLSAIGGIFALWLRGMPFSISAGIGFIALFGVAVLNGIVLISEMNRLRNESITDIKQAIMQATQTRLRPVLMTATVASLGFLPMAISNGAGAEVQRPLATVVIGGLFSATILTLLLLPSLYMLIEQKKIKQVRIPKAMLLVIAVLSITTVSAQTMPKAMNREEVIELALANAPSLQAKKLEELYYEKMKNTAGEMPKTQLVMETGNYNSIFLDSKVGVSQGFLPLGVVKKQKTLLDGYLQNAKTQTNIQKSEVVKLTEELFIQLQYAYAQQKLLLLIDSVYQKSFQLAKLRFDKGESNSLEKTVLENQVAYNSLAIRNNASDIVSVQLQLSVLLQTNITVIPARPLAAVNKIFDTIAWRKHPLLESFRQQQSIVAAQTRLEESKLNPDFFAGYNNQSITGWQMDKNKNEFFYDASSRFSSVILGINIPIFTKSQRARISAQKINEDISKTSLYAAENNFQSLLYKSLQEFNRSSETVKYYETSGLLKANTIMLNAGLNYQNGQINYMEWATIIHQALQVQTDYITAIYQQNMSAVMLNYLLQNQLN